MAKLKVGDKCLWKYSGRPFSELFGNEDVTEGTCTFTIDDGDGIPWVHFDDESIEHSREGYLIAVNEADLTLIEE